MRLGRVFQRIKSSAWFVFSFLSLSYSLLDNPHSSLQWKLITEGGQCKLFSSHHLSCAYWAGSWWQVLHVHGWKIFPISCCWSSNTDFMSFESSRCDVSCRPRCVLYMKPMKLTHNVEIVSCFILEISEMISMKIIISSHWNLSDERHFSLYRFSITAILHELQIEIYGLSDQKERQILSR